MGGIIIKNKHPDSAFLIITFLLVGLGLLMVFSTSSVVGLQSYSDGYYFIKKHFMHLFLGLLMFAFGYLHDYRKYQKIAVPGVFIAMFLLMLTYVPGLKVVSGGAARWLNLGPFSFQPSELIKFFVIIFVAYASKNRRENIKQFLMGIFPILCLVGLIGILVLKQPSLGSTVVIMGTAFSILFVAGASLWQMIILGLVSFRVLAYLVIRTPYQMRRFLAFLDPWKSAQSIGFQTVQSLLAIGSGGFWGLGLGHSKQKFSYLPQQYTDFIFAIFCEELGFFWAMATIVFFIAFAIRAYKIAFNVPERFAQLIAVGFATSISLQAVINLLVVTGMAPTTGIPLPFISYGGSNLVMNLFFVGILAQLSCHGQEN